MSSEHSPYGDHLAELTQCDHGYPGSEPCGYRPVKFYALSAVSPDVWGDGAGASFGGYCSLEHANAETRPSLEAAERVCGAVVEGLKYGERDELAAVWRRLIASYPDPIEASSW